MRDTDGMFRELGEETHGPGGRTDPLRPPSTATDPAMRDWNDVAAQVIARGRGVAPPWSWLSALVAATRRWLVRLLALPVSAGVGTLLGAALALVTTLTPTTWPTRLWRLPLVLLMGVFGGLAAGVRRAWKGKFIDLALVAALVHRWRPIVTLPRFLTHHLFGLVFVTRLDDVKTVLRNGKIFSVDVYDERMRAATNPFFLGLGPGEPYQAEREIGRKGVGTDLSRTLSCAQPLSCALVAAASKRPTHTLDVISELLHPVLTANLECFFGVPDTGDERVQEWLQTLSYYIFNFWVGGPYRAAAAEAGAALGQHLRDTVTKRAHLSLPIDDAVARMLAVNNDRPLIARTLAGLIAGATGPMTVLFPAIVDQLLDLPAAQRRRLRDACRLPDKAGDETVVSYVREAARLAPAPPLIFRHAATAYAFCGGEKNATLIERGAFVVTAPILANLDASRFERPGEFDPDRSYVEGSAGEPLIFGWGQHACLGKYMGLLLLTEMVKALFAWDVRRVAGPAGQPTKGPAGAIPEGDYAQRFIVEIR